MEQFDDVDAYVAASRVWPDEISTLRPILLGAGLQEAIKWGKPCYSVDGTNIVIMQEMKDFLALMFFKGALLEDPAGVLHDQGPNSRSARRMEFTSVDQIGEQASLIAAYVDQAVQVEQAGLTVEPAPEPDWSPELRERIDNDEAFKAGWESLTPGRRREYHLQIAGAKKPETRRARVEKFAPRISAGRGLRDRS